MRGYPGLLPSLYFSLIRRTLERIKSSDMLKAVNREHKQ